MKTENIGFVLVLFAPVASALIRPTLSSQSLAHTSAHEAGIRIDVASQEKGLGAFATSDIKCGQYIGSCTGEVLTRKQVSARYWGKTKPDAEDKRWRQSRLDRNQGISGNYIFEMKDGSFVDVEDAAVSGWERFMNHAKKGTSDCNIGAFDQIKKGGEFEQFPQFFATRDIQNGEELCYDYGPMSGSSHF